MSHCIVPSWNLSHQRQEGPNQGEQSSRSSHVDLDLHHFQQHHNSFSQIVPMSNFEVTELTWENGQLAMHELGAIFPPTTSTTSSPPKATWGCGVGRAGETLESIVHQATYCNNSQVPSLMPTSSHHQHSDGHQNMENVGSSVVGSSSGKWAESSGQMPAHRGPPAVPPPGLVKKRTRSESDHCAARKKDHEMSACASGNAAVSRDNNNNNNRNNNNDTTMMTWTSLESPRSCTRTKTATDEDSACHGGSENQEEDRETKEEAGRSYSTRKGRAAAVHNQSERRRRDRINQKMKALQKLVPNASKTDKASMLDEVIEYLKQLQAQVQMMSSARFMPHIMMPLGMQQHLHQMSLLARMGMGSGLMGPGLGMGIGMLDPTSVGPNSGAPQSIPSMIHPTQVGSAAPGLVPSAFVVPQMISAATQQPSPDLGTSSSAPLQDPYSTLLAQSMNIDLYNRMAVLQRQQQTPSHPTDNQLQSNHHVQRS